MEGKAARPGLGVARPCAVLRSTILLIGLLAALSGCPRPWKTIVCFELGGEKYTKSYYPPDTYTKYYEQVEAQAYFLYDSGDLQESLECFLQLREQVNPFRGATMVGVILTRLGQYDEALPWLENGIEETGASEWAQAALIWHFCEQEAYDKAEDAARSLTARAASTQAWNALKTVRRLREDKAERDRLLEQVPWMVGGAAAALGTLIFWLVLRHKHRLERVRAGHVKRMEHELRLLNVQTSLSIDQVKAKLLEERAKSQAATFLHKLVVDTHVRANDSSLRGIQGLLAIYTQSLDELDKLALDGQDKDRRRSELENALKDMVKSLSREAGS